MKRVVGVLILIMIAATTAMLFFSCSQPRSLSFEKDEYFVMLEQPFQPKVIIRPKNAEYTITSSNPTLASVEDNTIIPLKEGIVNITVSAGDLQHTAKVYIINDEEYKGDLPDYNIDYKRINFIVDDAVYTSPMLIQKGMVPGPPYDFVPPGYTLHGWYIDKEYTTKFNFNQPLEENVTLFGYLTLNEPQFIFDRENNLIESLMHPNLPYTEISFPEKDIYNQPIKGIKAEALKNNKTVEKITIPKSYEVIGNQAFLGCSSLKEVVFEADSQLKKIGIAAFDKCKELDTFTLSNSLTEIGGFAFRDCSKLEIKSLPPLIDTLNEYVFSGTATKTIDLDNIQTIKRGAFHNTVSLESVLNTHNVKTCEKNAFHNTKIFADSLSSQERAAYIDTILVAVRANTAYMKLKENVTLIADEALNAENLSNMILEIPFNPQNLSLGENVFEKTIAIMIPENYFPITGSSNPFFGYRSQVCVEVDEKDFKLLKFRETEDSYLYDIRQYYGDKVHLDIAEEFPDYRIRNIREGAFQNSDGRSLNLKSLNLREVEKIFSHGIANIESLIALFFTRETPSSINTMSIAKSSLGLGSVKIYVPEHLVTKYKGRTQWIHLQNHIYSMDLIQDGMATRTFENDDGFVIQYFGDEESVNIPDDADINIISEYAFMLNKAVKNITIGENIQEIGYMAFAYTEIQTITFVSEQPPVMNNLAFYKNSSLTTIYVPQGSRQDYIHALPTSVLYISGLEIIEV